MSDVTFAKIALSFAVVLASCGCPAKRAVTPDGTAPRASGGDPDRSGVWVLAQPSHAMYEATSYELGAGGELRVLGTVGTAPHLIRGVTGGARKDGVECTFARTWRAEGPRIRFGGDCSDGKSRDIVVVLSAGGAPGAHRADLETVGGETGWSHRWDWAFQRCADDQARCAAMMGASPRRSGRSSRGPRR